MTAFMKVELSLLTIKIICSVFITLAAALGVMIPYWSRKTEEEATTDGYAFSVCLCAGVLLSGSLVHLLPDAIEAIGTYSSTCLAGGCVMFLIIIGELATYLLPDKGAGHFPSARVSNYDEFMRKTVSRQDMFDIIEEGYREPDTRYFPHVGTEEAAVPHTHASYQKVSRTPSNADESYRIRLVNSDSEKQRERLLRRTEQEYIKNDTGIMDAESTTGGISQGGGISNHGSSSYVPPPIFVPYPPARPSFVDKGNQRNTGSQRNTGGSSEENKSRPRFSDIKPQASFDEKALQHQSADSKLSPAGEGTFANNENHHHHNISMEIRSYVLFLALSFHSIMEGLGIGSAQTEGVVGPIFVAIIAHKGLTGFALGNTLIRAQVVSRAFLFMVLTFSLCTPVGVFAGIFVADQGSTASGVGIALASGTFLQVSLLEITARQMAEEQFKFAKVSGLCIGFGAMSFLGLYV